MNRKLRLIAVLVTVTVLIFSLLTGCADKGNAEPSLDAESPEITVSPSEQADSPEPTKTVSKEEIESSLKAEGDKVIDITWSQDEMAVAFIKVEGEQSNVYLWKTGEEEAALVTAAEPTTDGFSWSPNSNYFLINVGHMDPETITSTLINADTLEVLTSEITSVSVSPPVWSADSRFLALSTYSNDGVVEIAAFAIASKTRAVLLNTTNKYGPAVVESWGEDNVIKLTEMTSTGERSKVTIEVAE